MPTLDAAVSYLQSHSGRDGVQQLVILHRGNIVYAGADADTAHDVWSVTKSFVSLALGLLLDDGKLALDQPVSAVLPELAPAYPAATFRHFASMSSGYRAAGDRNPTGSYRHGPSATPFSPDPEPLFAPPGSAFAYWDSALNQLAHALTVVAGEPLEALLRRRLADPLGIRLSWGAFDHAGLRVNGGAGNHGRGISICAHHLARLGQLILQRGRWHDSQLVSSDYLAQATSVQVPNTRALAGGTSDGRGHYGLGFWINADPPKWPGAPAETVAASGFNNNDLFILPAAGLVACRLGLDESTDGPITDDTYGAFLARLAAWAATA